MNKIGIRSALNNVKRSLRERAYKHDYMRWQSNGYLDFDHDKCYFNNAYQYFNHFEQIYLGFFNKLRRNVIEYWHEKLYADYNYPYGTYMKILPWKNHYPNQQIRIWRIDFKDTYIES